MLAIIDTFTPKRFLPVEVTVDTMEIIKKTTGLFINNNQIFVEIGDNRHSTTDEIVNLLDGICVSLIDTVIEDDCEYILFYC
jgi:hypothetical protein